MASPGLLLFLGSLLLIIKTIQSGYLITLPKDVQIGRPTPVCFSFHDSKHYMKVSVKLRAGSDTYYYTRNPLGYARFKCLYFTVPYNQRTGLHTLMTLGDDRGKVVFDKEINFNVIDSTLTFVETDKPAYKPGQTVRFRILSVDVDLSPSNKTIDKIFIKDPQSVIMKQWLDQSTPSGLMSYEFSISKEPVLGDWQIELESRGTTQKTKFEIKEYVLPKFEVTLTPPPYITIESETVEGEVCAIYTYGQPVKGKLKVTACVESSEESSSFAAERPCIYFTSEIDGCHKFLMKTGQLDLANQKYPVDNKVLNVTTSVLDSATGSLIYATSSKTVLSLLDLFLDIQSHSEPFYKPGLPYYIKVKATDVIGKPVVGITLGLRAEELGLTKEIITNEKGFGIYMFPAMKSNQTAIVFKVISLDVKYREEVKGQHSMATPGTSLVIEPWYSPTRSFMKITPLLETVSCGSVISLEVSVTQAPEKSFRLYIMVISKGIIVSTAEKKVATRDRIVDGCQEGFEIKDCIYRNKDISRKYGDVRVEFFLVDLPITADMLPSSQVIIYYVHQYGEVISDVADFKVSGCERNTVNLEFGSEEEYPGYETTLTIQAAPDSVCGLGVVDKSITLLGQVNTITPAQLLKAADRFKVDLLDPLDSVYQPNKEHCKKWLLKHEPPRRLIKNWGDETDPKVTSAKVSIIGSGWYPDDEDGFYYRVEHTDALQAFKAAGVVVVTDLDLETRPCEEVWKKPYLFGDDAFSGDDSLQESPIAKKTKKKQISVRDYFPETWLWSLEVVGKSGEIVINKELPHSITKWIGSAICTNKKQGVGVSNEATITTFQPFFTSFNLPYSAIRGEFIPIKVSTFNYLSACVQIRLELLKSEFIDIDPDIGSVTWLCICANEAKAHNFVIVPKKIGSINLTVVAEAIEPDGSCSGLEMSPDAVGVKDTVIRPLLVEPEGSEKEYTHSSLVCPEDSSSGQYRSMIDMVIPKYHVPDSARGFVSIIGDIMGPSLNSATDLLRVPYGCGEQNMIVFAPNVHIMKYTKASGQTDSFDKSSMEKFMVAGYQRELRYKHKDGSYSAFGESDDSGSTWLTAFVAKSFHQASEFIYIDKEITLAAFKWLKRYQDRDGCIRSVGRVIHSEMRGGIDGASNPGLLSAYVYTAMLEAEYPSSDGFIMKGVNCLKKYPATNLYTLVIYTYFAAKYKPGHTWHKSLVAELEKQAIFEDNMMYWKQPVDLNKKISSYHSSYGQQKKVSARDVEINAYALLAYQADINQNFVKMIKIVRWLSEQQNPNGGFISTQDTVLALQALAGYAIMQFKGSPSLSVFVDTFDYTKTYTINSTNSLVQQTTPIIAFPTSITVMAKGTGCSVLQATVRYNVIENRPLVESFELYVNITPSIIKPTNCKRRGIRICAKYNGVPVDNGGNVSSTTPPASNMAIVTTKMPTGWEPDMYTVNKLKQRTDILLKRIETDKNRPDFLNFYFDEFNDVLSCFEFDMVQDLEVKNLKPAYVSVYDYYDPDLKVQEFFEIGPDCAGSKLSSRPRSDENVDRRTAEQIEFETLPKNMLYENNQIDNSLLPKVTTPEPEVTTPPQSGCPLCEKIPLKKLVRKICSSEAAYTAVSLRATKLKLMRDFRPQKMVKIGLNVEFTIPQGCSCHLNNIKRRSKVLILMGKHNFEEDIKNKKQLALNSKSTVVLLNKTVKRVIGAAKRSRYCRGDKPRKKKTKKSSKKTADKKMAKDKVSSKSSKPKQ